MVSKAWYEIQNRDIMIKMVTQNGISEVESDLRPYCYVLERDRSRLPIGGNRNVISSDKISLNGLSVAKVEFIFPFDVKRFREMCQAKSLTVFEADIPYIRRWMIDKNKSVGKVYKKLYYDIETDDNGDIECIGVQDSDGYEETFTDVESFVGVVKKYQMLLGWNNKGFDRPILDSLVTKEDLAHIVELDVMEMYKHWTSSPSYALDYVAKKEVGTGKLELNEHYTKQELYDYNMRDVFLAKAIDKKIGLSDVRIEMATFTHIFPDEAMSAMLPIDALMLKTAGDLNLVLPCSSHFAKAEKYEGAYIIEPIVGVHSNIAVYDFESLYPYIIINERLSPDIGRKLLPEVLKTIIFRETDCKKKWEETGNLSYKTKREALKILRNACYGVFANPHFRLYDKEIAEAVTRKGREKIKEAMKHFENMNFKVIYGDTDSVFVQVDSQDRAKRMEKYMNKKLSPYVLKLCRYFYPVIFTGRLKKEKAVKKRYAGYDVLSGKKDLVVVGLEIKRSDSCELMRRVQLGALEIILSYKDKKEVLSYVRDIEEKVLRGDFDNELVFSKGVKDDVEDYKVEQPQVRVFKKMLEKGIEPDGKVHYVITYSGEEPVIDDKLPKNIDRKWYIKERIMPLVDRLLTVYKEHRQEKLEG